MDILSRVMHALSLPGGSRVVMVVGLAAAAIAPLEIQARMRTGRWLWDYWLDPSLKVLDQEGLTAPQFRDVIHRLQVFQDERLNRQYWQRVAKSGLTLPTAVPVPAEPD